MNPPMVNVVWLDTNECSMSTWQTKEELLNSQVCTIDSIGYLMADREDCVIIAGDKDTLNEDDMYGRTQIIPKGVIKDIQYLIIK
ncbi:hypothetical protein [uncultured Mediterranean phage uvMED]|nr:hypothetical protein [uncultured Mediterranean phage uvMED]